MTLLSDRLNNNGVNSSKEEDECTASGCLFSVQEENTNEYNKKSFHSLKSTFCQQRNEQDFFKTTVTKQGLQIFSVTGSHDVNLTKIVEMLQGLVLSANKIHEDSSNMLYSRVGNTLTSKTAFHEEFLISLPDKHSVLQEDKEHMIHGCRAAITGDEKLLHRLVTINPELVKMRWRGLSLIHLAAFGGHIDILRTLVTAGADVNSAMEQLEGDNDTHLDQKSENPNNEADLSWVVNHACVSPLLLAVTQNHIRVAELLIDRGAVKDETCVSSLFYAMDKGFVDLAQLLLSNGAWAHLQDAYESQTLMHVVKNYKLARMLIDRGLSVNTKDKKGCTPLHYAAARNSIDVS